MPFCPKCGAALPDGAIFCSKCGAAMHMAASNIGDEITKALNTAGRELQAGLKTAGEEIEKAFAQVRADLSGRKGPFCGSCGERNPESAKFCFACGREIRQPT